jgi:hypothetical protein
MGLNSERAIRFLKRERQGHPDRGYLKDINKDMEKFDVIEGKSIYLILLVK